MLSTIKSNWKAAKLMSGMGRKGQSTGFVGVIIALVIALIMTVNVLIPQVNDANTSGWGTSETTIFVLLPLIAVIGLFVLFARGYGLQ